MALLLLLDHYILSDPKEFFLDMLHTHLLCKGDLF